MTSFVFIQFDNDVLVDPNKKYYIDEFYEDTGLQEIHKYCLFPSKLSLELQKYLIKIEKESIINSKTHHGYTPLMISVMNDVNESVKLLLNYSLPQSKLKSSESNYRSVDINIQNDCGDTALLLVYDNIEIIKLLLERPDIDVNIQNNNDNTALMNACIRNNIEIVKLLLEYRANVNIQNKNEYTSLMYACINIKIVKLLLEYEADINIKTNYYNATALSESCYDKNIKIIKLLLQYLNLEENEIDIKSNYISQLSIIFSSVNNILSNINNSKKEISIKQLKKLNKFDYNSILLYEMKKCVW